MQQRRQADFLPDRCWVEVDLRAIQANARHFCALVGKRVLVIPAIKANGYGHGAVAVARAALDGGAARLAVANVAEGLELRQGGITAPIHVLGPLLREEAEAVLEYDLIPSLYAVESFHLLSAAAGRLGKQATVHLKIDTGMGRHGWFPAEAEALAPALGRLPGIAIDGAFTHLAQASDESYSRLQLAAFDRACAALGRAGLHLAVRHAANTVAAVLYPEARYEAIRPGLGLYGIHDDERVKERFPLEPALAWRTRVLQLKDYPAGQPIGYNRTCVTTRPTRAALLPVGYADGYRRGLSNRATVLLRGVRCPVLGLVSMDCTVVEVSHVPAASVGDPVTLVGTDGRERITVEELAALLPDTIPYEVVTSLGQRNHWHYRGPDSLQKAA